MSTIKTAQKTFNSAVKTQVKDLVIGAAKAVKKHVAGLGYVFYIKNAGGQNLAFVSRENGEMVITVK